MGDEGRPQIEFGVNRQANVIPYLEDVLTAIKKYADGKKKRATVVLDEFQQITFFGDDKVEKQIRTEIQNHRNVSYIFMGSKKHLIHDMFGNPTRPLYKSVKHFPLGKIKEEELIKFIRNKFRNKKMQIPDKFLHNIVSISECHPYYTQYLCHILWELVSDKNKINEGSIRQSLELLIKRESSAYQNMWDMLTTKQRQVLSALAKMNQNDKIFSNEFLIRYNLGSLSSVQRSLSSLIEKDIVDKEEDKYSLIDIFFKKWIEKKYT
jgi:hypothetical protein